MGIEEFVLDRAEKKGIAKGVAKGIAKGIIKGKAEGKAEDVKNLITKLGLTDAQVSEILEVSIAFVEKIRQELNK